MGANWEWSYQQGKAKRLEAEKAKHDHNTPVPAVLPLHSHDGTMQDLFEKGWASVTPVQIQRNNNPPPLLSYPFSQRLKDLLGN